MAFNWISFLDSHNIYYATSGPNVSRGNIAVHCPFCGTADKSQHMSIHLESKGWRCFRNRDQHKGKSPVYLVQALLNTTLDRAKAIVGDSVFIPDDFMGAVMKHLSPAAPVKKKRLLMPDEFIPIEDNYKCKNALAYLTGPDRQFTRKQALRLTRKYNMRFAKRGPQKDRVIFPVEFEGELVSWTGRTIHKSVDLRYKTLTVEPEDPNDPAAMGPINDYLLWYDQLVDTTGDTLILCEGPFDALKVSVLGYDHGIDATCFFTASPSMRQIDLLHDIAGHYKHRYLLLDRGTLGTAMRTSGLMSAIQMRILSLPSNVKDPGLLDERGLLKLLP